MTHCDPETLALAALGEPIPPPEAEHLAACEQCRSEVSDLAALVSLAREAPQNLTPAPDAVWHAIQAELGLGGAQATPSRVGPLGQGEAVTANARPAPDEPREDAGGEVVRMVPRRRLLGVAALAAAVGAIVGGATIWATLDRTSGEVRQDMLVAQAVLEPLSPRVTEPGRAQVLETPDGLVVRVDASSLPPATGFHEVWLLDADATSSLRSVPSRADPSGRSRSPRVCRWRTFPVVDISLEPYDGDPGHSHDSLLRGILEA